MPHRNYFRAQRQAVAVGGTYDEVKFGPILEDRHYHITRFAAEDETSAPSGDIRVYVDGHGDQNWLTEQDSPAAATLYWDTDETFLTQGESLVARFTGATAGDRLALYVEGWWVEREG